MPGRDVAIGKSQAYFFRGERPNLNRFTMKLLPAGKHSVARKVLCVGRRRAVGVLTILLIPALHGGESVFGRVTGWLPEGERLRFKSC